MRTCESRSRAHRDAITSASRGRNVGDAVDLDPQANSRQRSSLDGRASRAMFRENSRVYTVHLLEFLHVEQENAAAKDVLEIRTGRAKDGPDVLQALLGLRGGVGASEFAGRRISRPLPRHEN